MTQCHFYLEAQSSRCTCTSTHSRLIIKQKIRETVCWSRKTSKRRFIWDLGKIYLFTIPWQGLIYLVIWIHFIVTSWVYEFCCFLNFWLVLLAYILDGVNLKGYFAYAFSDQRDSGYGMYGHVQEEVISKSSLAHYKNIIHHNGFPAPGTPQQHCPHAPVHGSRRYVLTKQPVVGFLSLVSSCMLITVCLVIYYAVKRHKIATKKWTEMVTVDSF